jgi:transposase-like protein
MTGPASSPHDELAAIIGRIRAVRFQAGVVCPRCYGDRVHGWGSFAGRRRYRCLTCRRSFSDLTGTPAAYVKKLHLWRRHADLIEQGLTLRRVAASLGIHVATAFHWRHLILDEMRRRDSATLSGSIELADLWFAYSEKGRRGLKRPARRRAVACRSGYSGPTVRVALACDGSGGVATALVWSSSVRLSDLREAFARRVVGAPTIVAKEGPLSPAGRFARLLRGAFCWANRGSAPALLSNVRGYGARFRQWLKRFCGVATCYMPNYLTWHRLVDRTPAVAFRDVLLSWAARPPTVPPNRA